jgi:nitric oxide reductase activation protein
MNTLSGTVFRSKEERLTKCLRSLYIELPATVADDVIVSVKDRVEELKDTIEKLRFQQLQDQDALNAAQRENKALRDGFDRVYRCMSIVHAREVIAKIIRDLDT